MKFSRQKNIREIKMSEYWISPPHFGTLAKNNSNSVVHTPRNVELPSHVVLTEKPENQQGKRKCICLSIWLFGLVLLTAGAIVVAHFLIPEVSVLKEENKFHQIQTCPNLLPLEDKVKNSEYIVVGQVLPDLALEVIKVIKGADLKEPKLHEIGQSCFEKGVPRQIFFLAAERQGRSLSGYFYYLPKYHALSASPKVVEIVEKLVLEEQEISVTFKTTAVPKVTEISTTTEGKTHMNLLIFIQIQTLHSALWSFSVHRG